MEFVSTGSIVGGTSSMPSQAYNTLSSCAQELFLDSINDLLTKQALCANITILSMESIFIRSLLQINNSNIKNQLAYFQRTKFKLKSVD